MITNTRPFSCQNCQNSLEDLGVKVHGLQQEVEDFSGSDELPTEIVTLVCSLRQQHDRLLLPFFSVCKIRKTSELVYRNTKKTQMR